ncbi:spore maturation protein [Paenibacillus larvae]|uniref:Spore maturation protein B n=2 Tax=Paenibacillus larvae TaxID=1464 RepID=A0A2L1UC56_9BACL|nr:spore maturation protein [Paenibacillus larvae]AQR79397.1 spore maturation protein [Paenibacillus larvae subsp. larvae]AQT86219.1 spore maturation protein [Paenibacillus larvae subsp. pulvifaciens]AQZ47845.1 spore maturation protein [Paenibacillus larvae subsp. pulvifaciens]AVF23426.1 spore maturation protein B [Paenibacillus larvae subsp. larvae]AVF25735.1 spore maturation protein B [Paenibacillus larvae subsp. larvae]
MYTLISVISAWAIPVMIVFIPLYAAYRKVPVYESFVDGAKDGFDTAIKIIPHLVGMMVAISVFRASGAMDLLIGWMKPFMESIGVPTEVLPLAFLRPITGAGSLAFTADLIQQFGPDSMIGRIASTVQGSTDTTLYVITVYFGAIGIRKAGYALKVGLISDLIGFIASIIVCYMVFA